MNIKATVLGSMALVSFLSACGGDNESGPGSVDGGGVSTAGPTVTGDNTSTAEPAATVPDAAVLLASVAEAMSVAGSWQLEALLTVRSDVGAADPVLATTIEAARSGPGANIVVTNSSVQTGQISGGTSSENRVIGGVRYRRDPNSGVWSVSDASRDSPGLTIDASVVQRMDPSSASVAFDLLDGDQVLHVIGTVPGEAAAVTAELFVGAEDNLVRMVRLEGTAPASNFGGLIPGTADALPQTVEARYAEYGRPIKVHAPPGVGVEGEGGPPVYLSTINPFTMRLPIDLRSTPRTSLTGESFTGAGGEALFIVEEYLDVTTAFTGELAGLPATVDTYAQRFESVLGAEGSYEGVSSEPFATDSGLDARLLRFSQSDGQVLWLHLSYLHGEDTGFGATFGAFADRFRELEDAVLEAFRTFDVVD